MTTPLSGTSGARRSTITTAVRRTTAIAAGAALALGATLTGTPAAATGTPASDSRASDSRASDSPASSDVPATATTSALPEQTVLTGRAGQAEQTGEVYEVHHVPTVDGATIRVEIWRDRAFDAEKQPVVLTYSPYNSIGEPEPARDRLGRTYVPKGYARAVADVLGTRGSSGCWDYGGPKEQQSGVDVVKYVAGLPWSSGSVAMTGGSYNGTTASMVAARGDDVPELKAIIPIAAISRWYGYAYGNGVRYFLNSEVPTDEGFDTPLAFDAGFAKTVAADPMGQHFADTLRSRAAECGAVEHTEKGYDRNPDYDAFWDARDYRRDASSFRAAVLLAHGWKDYNVKQEEATELFRNLPVDRPGTREVEGVPFKLMYLTQGSHGGGTDGEQWDGLLRRFLAHTLKGVQNGIRGEGPVITEGASSSGPTRFRTESDYPVPSTRATRLWLRSTDGDGRLGRSPGRRGAARAYDEHGTSTEELPLGGTGLSYVSAPVTTDTRLVGSAVLDARVKVSSETMHLTPVLVDVAPDGSTSTIERGFQHVDYRRGLDQARPATDRWIRVRVRLLPQDYTLAQGHRFGLQLQSSNTVWAVPGNPGEVTVAEGPGRRRGRGSSLVLPTLG